MRIGSVALPLGCKVRAFNYLKTCIKRSHSLPLTATSCHQNQKRYGVGRMPFTLQAERSADQPIVRQANYPTSQLAGWPTCRTAGVSDNQQTNRSEGKRLLKVLADKAIPCHLLPQAATKGGNDTSWKKCPLLCGQKGRLTSLSSDKPTVRPAGLPDFRLASLPDSRRTGRPTSRRNSRPAGMLTDKPTGRTDCRPDNKLLTTLKEKKE